MSDYSLLLATLIALLAGLTVGKPSTGRVRSTYEFIKAHRLETITACR